MKKLFALLLAMMLVFSLAACGNNETPSGDEGVGTSQSDNQSNEDQGGENSDGGEENWMDAYKMSNLVIPEGATVSDPIAYDATNRNIERDTAFTEAEVAAFAQSVLENCNAPYTTKYDADKDEYIRVELTNAEDAKGLDEYGWKYEEDGKTYSIRIYFGMDGTLGFEKYES